MSQMLPVFRAHNTGISRTLLIAAKLIAITLASRWASAAETAPLTLEIQIPLGQVSGRIDHLAFDPTRGWAYVAELGNNTVGIVDLKARRVIRTATGFDEPQGVGYEVSTDTIYIANGGDGSVRVFSGSDFAPLGQVPLGKDADNVRIDRAGHRVYIGYGAGALAAIDPATRTRIADIPLKGHPESFQLDPDGDSIFVNVPDAGQIAVVSRKSHQQTATWRTGQLSSNYPLALDTQNGRVMSVFRHPARLQAYEPRTGQLLNGADVCMDSDDAFVDSKRHRVYVICGQGYVDILDSAGGSFTRIGRVATSSGSRTGLYIPELDRLLVAIRAVGKEPAALWILQPSP